AGISALFDLLDATARSDLRHELIQELERQRQRLIAKNASADPDMAAHLAEIGAAIQAVSDSVGRTTQSVRENQWLQIIRTRQSIAGGTCEFDLPQMHLWMNTTPEIRRRELQSYVSTLEPIRTGTMLLLRIFRANSHCQSLTAVNGTYQFSMNRNQNCALVQIWLPADSTVVPEVSANKYMLWIRFSRPDENHKLHLARTEEIPFRLGLCTPS
ncbi:MAG: cell division protein ZapD, partial [Sutterella wadsworthensis]